MQLWQLMMLGEAASKLATDRDGDGQTIEPEPKTVADG